MSKDKDVPLLNKDNFVFWKERLVSILSGRGLLWTIEKGSTPPYNVLLPLLKHAKTPLEIQAIQDPHFAIRAADEKLCLKDRLDKFKTDQKVKAERDDMITNKIITSISSDKSFTKPDPELAKMRCKFLLQAKEDLLRAELAKAYEVISSKVSRSLHHLFSDANGDPCAAWVNIVKWFQQSSKVEHRTLRMELQQLPVPGTIAGFFGKLNSIIARMKEHGCEYNEEDVVVNAMAKLITKFPWLESYQAILVAREEEVSLETLQRQYIEAEKVNKSSVAATAGTSNADKAMAANDKKIICHNCGEPGHIRPKCPKLVQDKKKSTKNEVCRNFGRTGKCRFGKKCKFLHVEGANGTNSSKKPEPTKSQSFMALINAFASGFKSSDTDSMFFGEVLERDDPPAKSVRFDPATATDSSALGMSDVKTTPLALDSACTRHCSPPLSLLSGVTVTKTVPERPARKIKTVDGIATASKRADLRINLNGQNVQEEINLQDTLILDEPTSLQCILVSVPKLTEQKRVAMFGKEKSAIFNEHGRAILSATKQDGLYVVDGTGSTPAAVSASVNYAEVMASETKRSLHAIVLWFLALMPCIYGVSSYLAGMIKSTLTKIWSHIVPILVVCFCLFLVTSANGANATTMVMVSPADGTLESTSAYLADAPVEGPARRP